MAGLRGRTLSHLVAGLNAGQHLAIDALVAFVDGELGPVASERAASHLSGCPSCAAEVAVQRHTRSLVRSAPCPQVPANVLAALRSIPLTIGPADPAGPLGA
jgi:anti-sigma factor RsiW